MPIHFTISAKTLRDVMVFGVMIRVGAAKTTFAKERRIIQHIYTKASLVR